MRKVDNRENELNDHDYLFRLEFDGRENVMMENSVAYCMEAPHPSRPIIDQPLREVTTCSKVSASLALVGPQIGYIEGTSFYVSLSVNHNGCHGYIKELGVSLTVPQGAVKKGDVKHLYFGVSWRDCDLPNLRKGQTRTSPVVVCGPHGTHFECPVLLAFPHCIPLTHTNVTRKEILCSETGEDESCSWQEISNNSKAVFTKSKCIISIDHFTKHTTACDLKRVRASVFGQRSITSSSKRNVSVYCIPDTQDEIQVMVLH